jgi:hypothetical protein
MGEAKKPVPCTFDTGFEHGPDDIEFYTLPPCIDPKRDIEKTYRQLFAEAAKRAPR